MKKYQSDIEQELIEYLGEEDFLKLVENYAGTRLFIAKLCKKEPTKIERCIGRKAAEILDRYYGGCSIAIPMARALRAKRYREEGMSNSRIAVKLGITESGVEKLFNRLKRAA